MDNTGPLDHSITNTPSAEEVKLIADNVIQFGRASNPNGGAMPIVCLVHDRGELVAGGTGRTEFGRLFVNYLWVAEPLRCRGLATQILANLEREAQTRGCHDALIETLLDPVAAFYQRLGYRCIASLADYSGPVTRYTLVKTL